MLVSKPLQVLLFGILGAISAFSAPTKPVVNLGYTEYQGFPTAQGNIDFLGIRYAAPPTGDLRFRAPQAPEAVDGIQLADKQPNICPQAWFGLSPSSPWRTSANKTTSSSLAKRGFEVPPPSEDCLFLNVAVPGSELKESSKRPVVVWFHGGGYVSGSASWPGFAPGGVYDADEIVKLSNDNAIVVLIQYRLGLHGFLAGKGVKKDGALNAGLLDQQFALQWVQKHISKFGGDPGRVTIWGQSAGGGAVLQHLIANGGQTKPALFQNAILNSAYAGPQYRYDERIPEAVFSEVVTRTGCASARNKLQCLRNVDSKVLSEVQAAVASIGFYGTFVFGPVVDGTVIQDAPLEALHQKKINKANVLTVTNSDEGSLFTNSELVLDSEDYIAQLFPTFPNGQLKTAAAHYTGLGSKTEQATLIMGESLYVCPTYTLLRSLGNRGYKGHFAVPPATHGADVAYYFPSSLEGGPPFKDPQFIATFAGALLDFAVTHSPNAARQGSLLPAWPRWSEANRKEMVFNRTDDSPAISVVDSLPALQERCRYWDTVAQFTGQ
ncbi:Alpha/Beta hydrolase protein [Ephemerocybe angulata]|uniref:Carboxylic ester hydrolase n=1 Tax=Ephemerocybe angulata TaxID=980116 RepID=A0A8H6I783_9AGAR|nr:Alpha/Beta hydrolase protein [Tulosesus angulatus]